MHTWITAKQLNDFIGNRGMIFNWADRKQVKVRSLLTERSPHCCKLDDAFDLYKTANESEDRSVGRNAVLVSNERTLALRSMSGIEALFRIDTVTAPALEHHDFIGRTNSLSNHNFSNAVTHAEHTMGKPARQLLGPTEE
jgi:hypothetical protein